MARRRRGKRNPYQGDAFTQKAKKEGFAARSVYKLTEIQKRFRPLKQGQRAVDLGCSPGSWARYVLQVVGKKGALVGVDINPPEVSGFTFLHRSVMEVTPDEIRDALGGPADVVLSDMAPLTTGMPLRDHVAQLDLARQALTLAVQTLAPGGHFVVKVFDGEDAHAYTMDVRQHFDKVKRVRPEAVRKNSREFFLVCLGYTPVHASEE